MYYLLLMRSSSLKLVIIVFHNWANLAASFSLLDGIWTWHTYIISTTLNLLVKNEGINKKGKLILKSMKKVYKTVKGNEWITKKKRNEPRQICEIKWLSVPSFWLPHLFLLESNNHWMHQAKIETGISAFLKSESGDQTYVSYLTINAETTNTIISPFWLDHLALVQSDCAQSV